MTNLAKYEMVCKHRTVFTPQELLEMDLDEEKNLIGVKRSYMLYNRDYWDLLLGTDARMIKFKNVLKILKKERKNVAADLNIAQSSSKLKDDKQIHQKIQEMVQENSELVKMVRQRGVEIRETEGTIRSVSRILQKLRNSQVTDVQYQQKNIEGIRTVEKLENRLDIQEKKFGLITKENKLLREQIDHHLKERYFFNIMWERQLLGMFKRKKYLLDLFQQSTVAYNKRDECVQTLNALRTKAYKDLLINCEEMENLEHLLDDHTKASNFFETKQQVRKMKDLEQITEKRNRLKKIQLSFQYESYSNILSNIHEFLDETDINSIVITYLKQEAINDSNFRLVTQINADIETIGKSLRSLLSEINKHQEIEQRRKEQQMEKLEMLKIQLEESIQEANKAEATKNEQEEHFKQIYAQIYNMFKSTKCDITPFLSLLGENSMINRYNVLLFLDVIQDRITDLVIAAMYKQKMEKKTTSHSSAIIRSERLFPYMFTPNEIVTKNPCPLCVEQEMVSDVIDTLQFARTKAEVREKLQERIALPDGTFSLHSVSHCNLPKSREIVQKRYQ